MSVRDADEKAIYVHTNALLITASYQYVRMLDKLTTYQGMKWFGYYRVLNQNFR